LPLGREGQTGEASEHRAALHLSIVAEAEPFQAVA
jgi:hypothetical protein